MNHCSENFMKFYELASIVLLISKVFIPFLIILFGTFDIFKIVIKSKDKEQNNKINIFLKRIIAGLIIFFLPNIILFVFERVGLDKTEYSCAYNCVLDISQCEY